MLLSIDSSAVTASVALTDGGRIISNEFVNSGLTHSETLLPMIKRVMGDVPYSDLDGIAVTVGPGSFTGIRIGVATVKGLAFVNNIRCYGVSTLEAIAYNFADENCIVCAVMDARRMQFYNALFSIENGTVSRIVPDRAISIEDLRTELAAFDKVILAGDGAKLCFDNIGLDNCVLAPEEKMYQNAASIAGVVRNMNSISPKALMPVYLRQSQAERELKKKENKI